MKIYNARNHIYGENFKLKLRVVQNFSLIFLSEVRVWQCTYFERIFWRARLVKHPADLQVLQSCDADERVLFFFNQHAGASSQFVVQKWKMIFQWKCRVSDNKHFLFYIYDQSFSLCILFLMQCVFCIQEKCLSPVEICRWLLLRLIKLHYP